MEPYQVALVLVAVVGLLLTLIINREKVSEFFDAKIDPVPRDRAQAWATRAFWFGFGWVFSLALLTAGKPQGPEPIVLTVDHTAILATAEYLVAAPPSTIYEESMTSTADQFERRAAFRELLSGGYLELVESGLVMLTALGVEAFEGRPMATTS